MTENRYVPCAGVAPESIDLKNRTLVASITTSDVDRDGEIVEPSAFEARIGTFKANPLLLWMHNPFLAPIGKVLDLSFQHDRINATLQFAPAGRSALADEVWENYADGSLSSFSIGFRVHGWDRTSKPVRIVDAELYEVSAVTVPANPCATAKGVLVAKRLNVIALREEMEYHRQPNPAMFAPNLPATLPGTAQEFWLGLAKECVREARGAPPTIDELVDLHFERKRSGVGLRAALAGWTRLGS